MATATASHDGNEADPYFSSEPTFPALEDRVLRQKEEVSLQEGQYTEHEQSVLADSTENFAASVQNCDGEEDERVHQPYDDMVNDEIAVGGFRYLLIGAVFTENTIDPYVGHDSFMCVPCWWQPSQDACIRLVKHNLCMCFCLSQMPCISSIQRTQRALASVTH